MTNNDALPTRQSAQIITLSQLLLSNVEIRQDTEGRYCLNDLHKVAGGEARHQVSFFMMNLSTKDLITELEKDHLLGIPSISAKRGVGTYVTRELVYAYATWISASFHLKVIRAYDSLTTQQQQTIVPRTSAELLLAQCQQLVDVERLQASHRI